VNVLETRALSKRFGRVQAVHCLNLSVPQGSVFGVLGPNGSGKTTTLGMALGSIRPDSGTVVWGRGEPPHVARETIGALLDGPAFHPALSAEQNLRVVSRVRRVDPFYIDSALERAGVADRRASLVQTFSLGMKQRLALAAALLGNPKIIVLDEPANGLDPQGIVDLRRIVRAAAADGATVILASHVLDEIEKVCTHVAVMAGGRLLASGPIESVVANGGGTTLEDAFLSLVNAP
jgi:ABC-type multidrug transport system ATPase subunit